MSAPFAIATKSKHSMNVIGDSIANRLGCLHVGNATATIKCLRTRTSLDIVFHASQDMTSLEFDSIDGNPVGDALIWGPSFDGVHINGTLMKMLANPSPAVKERLSKMSVMVGMLMGCR